jgi:hypothetical protein
LTTTGVGRRPEGCLPYNRRDVINILTRLIDDEIEDDLILSLARVWQLNHKGHGTE